MELAPAHDPTHAYDPKGKWTYQHPMRVNGKCENITRENMLLEAERLSVSRPKNLLEQVQAV
jgi:serine/threonine-protein kinase HipA